MFSVFMKRARGRRSYQGIANVLANRYSLETSKQTVWRDEKGKSPVIPPERMRAYADVLQVPYVDLVQIWSEQKYGVEIQESIKDPSLLRALSDPKHIEVHQKLQTILESGDSRFAVEAIDKSLPKEQHPRRRNGNGDPLKKVQEN